MADMTVARPKLSDIDRELKPEEQFEGEGQLLAQIEGSFDPKKNEADRLILYQITGFELPRQRNLHETQIENQVADH